MEASELFGICAELASQTPSADASRRLQEVIVLSAAEGCRQQGGAFGNLFSQIDFLSKKRSTLSTVATALLLPTTGPTT